MFTLSAGKNHGCEQFLEELESFPVENQSELGAGEVLARLTEASRKHAPLCADCRQALTELLLARNAFLPMRANQPEAGPWFTARVMAAITAKEQEIEEKNGVWISVRRLAPRLVAFCALLLVVGSTWALQLRRADEASQVNRQRLEGLFDTGSNTPAVDDATSILSSGEARP